MMGWVSSWASEMVTILLFFSFDDGETEKGPMIFPLGLRMTI